MIFFKKNYVSSLHCKRLGYEVEYVILLGENYSD